jgi:hypothetical protein
VSKSVCQRISEGGLGRSFDMFARIADNRSRRKIATRPRPYNYSYDHPILTFASAMAKPILTVLLKGPLSDVFRFVEALLQPLGFVLANPESGRITHWSDDGEQITTPCDRIISEASAATMKNVQFWSASSEDLFVSWIDASPGWWFSFHLNGVTPELKIALTTALSNSVLIDLKLQYEDECAFRIDFD